MERNNTNETSAQERSAVWDKDVTKHQAAFFDAGTFAASTEVCVKLFDLNLKFQRTGDSQ